MGQQSLYRRYRPQTFSDVVGQGHVTRTLQNALAEQRLPHACLFSGPRGTGKTSTARILAKALNCEQAPTREPCNVCASCRGITAGTSLDVVEIDAASHGSVDDARELREKVAYAPVAGRWKIYILDECHMLTTAANNALLKVLEEPPGHVVFVFATTEPSKVLQTVLDRCQRYEFRAVEPDAVARRLLQVCEAEGVAIEGAAASLIASRTTGSVRDALGLLDQAMSYSGSSIGVEDISRLFGAVPGEILFEAVDLISERDAGACFAFTDRLIRSGQDPREFLRSLIDHLRSVFLVQHASAAQEILNVADDQLDRLRGQANRFAPGDLLRILDLAGEAHLQLRQAADSRLGLEIAVVRMARPELHASPASLLARLERLERMSGLAGDAAAAGLSPAPLAQLLPHAAPARAPVERPAPVAPPPARREVVAFERPPPAAVAAPAPPPPALAPITPPGPLPPPADRPVPAPVPAPAAAAPPAPAVGPVDLERIARAWDSVLAKVKAKKISAQAMLHEARPSAYEHDELVLEFAPTHRFHRDKVADPRSGYLLPLVEALFDTFGVRPSVRCVLGDGSRPPAPPASSGPGPNPQAGSDVGEDVRGGPPPARPRDPIDLIREGFAAEIVEES
ncbi:MAG TPA: DNA polymerase III subunit gamma/tau [Actinomycetota bacterium]|nr:DNA polymerase III subunit gamma/tau [Actinomycetota bacterium]